MDPGILITAGIGAFTTFFSGFVTWLFSKKKYNAEVDSTTIKNLSSSVDVYKAIVKDLENKIDSYIEVSEKNRIEVIRLKGIVYRLINKVCTDGTCTNRQPYTTEEVEEIMGMLEPEGVSNKRKGIKEGKEI